MTETPSPPVQPDGSCWSLLISEPTTGVTVLNRDGVIRYVNQQSVSIYEGQGTPEDYIGRNIADLPHGPEWVEERMEMIRGVIDTGQPRLLRTLWRGYQHLAWFQALPCRLPEQGEAEAAGRVNGSGAGSGMGPGSGSESGSNGPDQAEPRVLIITRRVAGDPADVFAVDATVNVVESRVMALGPLSVLTDRELEVLALIGQGHSLQQMADLLHRSVKTLEKHRQALGMKLRASNRVELAKIAERAGLTQADAKRQRIE